MLKQTVPSSLYEVQTLFAEIITQKIEKVSAKGLPVLEEKYAFAKNYFSEGKHLSWKERITIYRQQYWYRLWQILQEDFPSLVRLFGYKTFNTLIAEPYLTKYFPDTWNLMHLGKKLVPWILEEYFAEDKELIYHCAVIDDAYTKAYLAGQRRDIVFDVSRLEREKIFLQDYVILCSAPKKYLSFHEKLLEKDFSFYTKNAFPLLCFEPQYFVIYREGFLRKKEEITEEDFTLLSEFQRGEKLQVALQNVSYSGNIYENCQKWVQRKWFSFDPP